MIQRFFDVMDVRLTTKQRCMLTGCVDGMKGIENNILSLGGPYISAKAGSVRSLAQSLLQASYSPIVVVVVVEN